MSVARIFTGSLRGQILLIVAVVLGVAAVSGWFLTRTETRRLAQDVQDSNLRAMAFGFLNSAAATDGSWITPEELSDFVPADVDQYFYRLIGPNGSFISGYNFVRVPVPSGNDNSRPVLATWQTASGEEFRGISIRAFSDDGDQTGWVTLQVAQNTRGVGRIVSDQMRSYALTLFIYSTGIFAAFLLLLSLVLRPVRQLSESLARRSAQDLTSVRQDVPSEMRGLKQRINDLFAQVREEQQAKDRLIGNAAHQLRTPLTTIRLRTELARTADDPALHLDEIERETDRAAGMARQLVKLERRPAGRAGERLVPAFDLIPVTRAVLEDWRPVLAAAGITCNYALRSEEIRISGDMALYTEILSNLIDNCLKHSGGTQITVTAEMRNDGSARVTVSDNGTGVPAGELQLITERFYRGQTTTADGHGLGLSIAEQYADSLGAQLTFGPADDAASDMAVAPDAGGLCACLIFPPAVLSAEEADPA